MDKSQIGIIAAVVVVIALVGTAAVFLMGGNNNGDGGQDAGDRTVSTTFNMWVCGNANADDYVNQADVDLLEKIVAGTENEVYGTIYDGFNPENIDTRVSLADANNDGKIDQDDVDYLKRLIAFQERYAKAVAEGTLDSFDEKFTAYYVNCDLKRASVELPIKNFGVIYYNNAEIVRLLGATDRVVLSEMTVLEKHTVMLPEFQGRDIINLEKTRFNLDPQAVLDAYNTRSMTAVFTGPSSTYSDGLEGKLDNKVDVIRLPAWEDGNFMAGTLTLGYFLGTTEKAYEYNAWAQGYINTVKEALKDTPATDILCVKGRTADLLAGNGNGSGRSEITELAGANNLVTSLPNAPSEYPTVPVEWALSVKPTAIIMSASAGYEQAGKVQTTMIDVYNAAKDLYKGTPAANNDRMLMVADDILTGPAAIIGMVYIAKYLHPDKTASIDADRIFQDYVDKFGLGPSYKVAEHMDQFIYSVNKTAYGGWYAWDPTVVSVNGNYSNCTPSFMSITENVYKTVYGNLPDFSGITLKDIPEKYLYKYSDYTKTVDGKLVVKTFDDTSDGKKEAFVDKTLKFTPTKVICNTDAYVDTIYMIYCDYFGEKDHCGMSPKAEAATWNLCSAMTQSVKDSLKSKYGLEAPASVDVIGGTTEALADYCGNLDASEKVIVLTSEYGIRGGKAAWTAYNDIEANCDNVQFVYILSNSAGMVLSTMEMIGEIIGCTSTETMMTKIMAEIYVMQKAIDESGVTHVFYAETTSKGSVASNTLMGGIFADILKMKNVIEDDSLMGGTISDEKIVELKPDVIAFYDADSRTVLERMRAVA